MEENSWIEIREMETRIADGDAELLKDYVDHLAKRGLLNSHMVRGLTDCQRSDLALQSWAELHEFAKERFADDS